MRILVADDEQVMLESINRMLEKEPEIILETARTGREAIEKTQIFRPDLVIMDIKMPGISGLEALSEIRRIDPQVVLVILSAYDNFSYAQEAIANDAFEYLLKPVNKARILELVKKVRLHLEKMRSVRQEELELREKYQKSLPLIENEFLHTMTTGCADASLREYQELLGIKFSAGFFVAISYLIDSQPFDCDNEPQYFVRERMAGLTEEIRHLFPCLVGPVKTNPVLIFVPLPSRYSEVREQEFQEAQARKILDRLNAEKLPVKFRIGIGSVCESAYDYRRSYQEALQALNSVNQTTICYFQNLNTPAKYSWEAEFEEKMQEILESIRFGHLNRLELLLDNFRSQFFIYEQDKDRLLCYLLELLLSAWRIGRTAVKNIKAPGFQELFTLIDPDKDSRELVAEIADRLLDLAQHIHEHLQNQTKTIILRAKEIIDCQFQRNINLEELARTVAISPFYLCRLFREELGVSFTAYLTKVRLEKAIPLLAQGLSVKECCFAVGYNDPNYFSRIFRKHYRLTPSEYRETQLQKKGGPPDNE